jgi:hypothetical protein
MTYETMPESLYLIVEAEPFLSICREWKHRHDTARAATFAFAEKHGSNGVFPDFYGDVIGITVQRSVPPGWSVKKARRVAQHHRLMPAKGQAGDAVRAEIAALPKHPRHAEIADAIGHPCNISYKCENGRWGSGVMGDDWEPVSIGWAGDTFIIKAPNADRYVAQQLAEYPNCTITLGHWTVPDGLTRITKAEKELLYAQAAVDQERSVA